MADVAKTIQTERGTVRWDFSDGCICSIKYMNQSSGNWTGNVHCVEENYIAELCVLQENAD